MSREEMVGSEDLGNYFRIRPDMRDLNYGKFFEEGESKLSLSDDYNSHNTTRLDIEGMKALLMKLDFIKDLVAGKTPQAVD
jgi:UDP-glucose 4-epimerase